MGASHEAAGRAPTNPSRRGSSYGRRSDGEATSLRIIVTAERLYAERGLDGVSLREIGQEAGQRNTAVVQYHFGGRDELIAAIFDHGSALVDELRAPLVAGFGATPSVIEVATAVVRPFAASVKADSHYAPFLARLMADHQLRPLTAAGVGAARPSFHVLAKELKRQLDHLPRPMRDVRANTVVEFTVTALAAHRGAVPGEPLSRVTFDRYVDDLVQVVAGMIAAPARSS